MVGNYFSVRGTSYQFRLAIPAELKGVLNRHEFRWVIPVRQRRVAERIAILAYCGCIQIFREAALASDSKQIDWAKLARDHFEKCVDRFRADAPGHLSLTNDEKKSLVREWDLDIAELANELAGNFFYDATMKRAAEVISENGYDWESFTTPDKHKAIVAVVRAEMESQRAAIHGLENPLLHYEPSDELFRHRHDTIRERFHEYQGANYHLQADGVATDPEATSLSDAIKEFLDEEAAENRWKPKTRLENIGHLKWFADHVGPEIAISRIDRPDIVAFKNSLLRVRKKVDTSMRFQDCLTEDATNTIHRKTAIKKLGTVKSFFRWATDAAKIERDPAGGVVFDRPKSKMSDKVKDFDATQITSILKSPAFTGCQSPRNEKTRACPGDVVAKDEFYWLFLLLLYTGARLDEIVSLPLKNVQLGAIPHLILSAKEQELKTAQSEREIPLHPELLRLGFADFITKRKAHHKHIAAIWLYNEKVKDPMGGWSKRFNRYLDAIGFSDPRYRMHSFRHTFITAMRNAGVPDSVQRTISGHAKRDVSETYGSAPNIEKLSEYVASVDLGVPAELLDELRSLGETPSPSEPE